MGEDWDLDTKLVSVTEGLCFEPPQELRFPTPGN